MNVIARSIADGSPRRINRSSKPTSPTNRANSSWNSAHAPFHTLRPGSDSRVGSDAAIRALATTTRSDASRISSTPAMKSEASQAAGRVEVVGDLRPEVPL